MFANGLAQGKSQALVISQVKRMIKGLSVQLGLSATEANSLYKYVYAQYLGMKKKSMHKLRKEKDPDQRLEIIYNSIRAKVMDNDLIREANHIMYMYEHRMKIDQVFGEDGLLATSSSPFFMSSSHPKPAKDHVDWEGMLFYDEDWEEKGDYSDPEKEAIRAYIKENDLKSVQWVTGPPVYLIFRPNCKHFLKSVPLKAVLSLSQEDLHDKYRVYMKNETSVSRNVLYYREYYNRLKIEEAFQALIPNDQLSNDINKDKKLLDKWKKTL